MVIKLRPYIVWIFIAIVGTFIFWRYQCVQNELLYQEHELAAHQSILIRQVKINEQLRSERSNAISEAIIKQCVQDYRIDGKLLKLSSDLVSVPSLDPKIKKAIAAFSSDVSHNQGALQCQNPLTKRLQKVSLK